VHRPTGLDWRLKATAQALIAGALRIGTKRPRLIVKPLALSIAIFVFAMGWGLKFIQHWECVT
jgi:hypothetical protein